MVTSALLTVENICKSFGALRALDDVSLGVEEGRIFGLVGPNGSGKTTLFNVITGFASADSGRVVFNGEDITGWRPDQVARRGLVRTFQAPLNPRRLTVMENMLLAPQSQTGESIWKSLIRPGRVKRQEEENIVRAWRNLQLVRLDHQADTYAGELSGGQKKLLMLGQTLMLSPKLVLLDEPVAGVNPRLVNDIVETIRTLQSQGQNFLIIEHNMGVVRRLCDTVWVLDGGKVLAGGPCEEILERDDVLQAYLARQTTSTGAGVG